MIEFEYPGNIVSVITRDYMSVSQIMSNRSHPADFRTIYQNFYIFSATLKHIQFQYLVRYDLGT